MPFTLRQFQRVISAAKRDADRGSFPVKHRADIVEFISARWGRNVEIPAVSRDGRLWDVRTGDTAVYDPAGTIDSMVRAHGPNTPITDFVRPKPPEFGSEFGAVGRDVNTSKSSTPESDPPPHAQAAEAGEEEWVPTPPEPEREPPKTSEERQAEKTQQLREQLRELKAQAKMAEQQQGVEGVSAQAAEQLNDNLAEALAQLQNQVKQAARKQAQLDGRRGQTAGPSLESRRRAAGTHGRLRRVPPDLRNKTAEIINRLVSDCGTAGDRLAPIPVLSPRKVVKRMVVRRSLSNALKEDCNSGRPVTLFLPDVSPSCKKQAQIACDISNAAGYAGVSGSDVLVFPHSNGEVEEGYVPWFNGSPKLVKQKEVTALFHRLISGQSGYNIRVVVAIGDHDAEKMYHEIAKRREVQKLVWLHNEHASAPPSLQIVPPTDFLRKRLKWGTAALAKTTLVAGCVSCASILAGLALAIK